MYSARMTGLPVRIYTNWIMVTVRIFATLCGVILYSCAGQAQMRVASLNIAKQYGPKVLAEIGKQPDLRKADVLLLQEVVDGPESHMAFREMGTLLGLNVVFEPAFQLNGRFMEGLAIMSRYPIGAKSSARLAHNELHFHTRGRIVLAATVESPLGPLRIVNTHLDNRINRDAKVAQLAGIWNELGNYAGPCLIGGDFNSGNFRWISHVLPIPGVQSLRAAVDQEMMEHGFSTPLGAGPGTLHFLGLKLDWIYLRGLSVGESGVAPIGFSDHNSVWVVVDR